MSINRLFPALILTLLLATGCAQLSSFQTGRTLEDELIELGGALEGIGVYDPNPQGGDLGSAALPNLRLWARAALTDNIEAGLSLSTGLNAKVDGRIQLIGDKASAFAGAVGLGYEQQFAVNNSNEFVFRAHLPVYLSYHPRDKRAIYATPRYSYQYARDDSPAHFIGSSFGYQRVMNNALIWNAELSYFLPLTDGTVYEHLFLIGVGLKYQLFR